MSFWVGTLQPLAFSCVVDRDCGLTYDERAIVLVVSRLVVVEEAGEEL